MHFTPVQLRVNRSRSIRLTDRETPEFSWAAEHSGMGAQVACRLCLYLKDRCLWDSCWISSGQQEALYQGPALESCRTYRWTVQLQDQNGQESTVAESTLKTPWFAPWDAQWVAATQDSPGKAVYYRKGFAIEDETESATLLVCGLGYQHVTLNGIKTGDDVLSPAVSNYAKRCYYTVADVTGLIRRGQNILAVIVGEGWRRNEDTYLDALGERQVEFFGRPQLTAMLVLRCSNGEIEIIMTDGTWQWAHGPIVHSHLFNGETYDQRLELPGWDSGCEYADAFRPVMQVPEPGGRMLPQTLEPIREKQTYTIRSVTQPKPGVYVLDFGQNIAGYVHADFKGMQNGQKITIRHAEVLQEDSLLYTAPLRSAKATDTVLCSGADFTWQPLFTYHGFRYAEVTGLDAPPRDSMFTAIACYTDLDTGSTFSCGSALVNQIYRNILQTERANLHSVATDCPQRDERMGWMNDATVRFVELPYSFDAGGLFPKIIRDIMDEQSAYGAITCTAPYVYGSRPADPVCSSFLVAGMQALLHQGDKATITEAYNAFKAWNSCLAAHAPDGIVDYSYYGDWAGPEYACDSTGVVSAATPGILMSTGYHYYNYVLLGQFAEALGWQQEAQAMALEAGRVRTAFLEKWWDEATGTVATGSQGCQAFALWLGILPQEKRSMAAERMIEAVDQAGGRFTTGNLCTTYLIEMLCDYGYENAAWALLTSEEYPSWGYMIQNGATTVWERFEMKKDPGMNSHNHPMYAAVGSCLYSRLAGIRPTAPGFTKALVAPVFPDKLHSAEAVFDTCKGMLHVKWIKQYGHLHVYVTVPFGMEAEIRLPWQTDTVGPGFWHFDKAL